MMYDRITNLIIEESLDEVAGSVGSRRPGRWGDQSTPSTDDDDDKPAYDDSIDKTYERVKKLLSPVGKAAGAVGRGVRRVAQSKKARAVARGLGKGLGKTVVLPTEGQYKRRIAKGLVNVALNKTIGYSPFNTKRPKNKKAQQQDDES